MIRNEKRLQMASIAALLAFAATLASGCINHKEKATKTFKSALKKCQKTDDPFYQVELFNGAEKTDVLAQTCGEKMGKIKMEEGNQAEVKVGPYLWRAGLDDDLGLWVMKGVDWDTLKQARRRLNAEDPGKNEINHAINQLAKAQKTYPKSGWLRLERLRALLRLRNKTRSNNDEEALQIGSKAKKHLKATIAWAQKNEHHGVAAKARLQEIGYIKDYIRYIESAKGTLGSQDDYYKKSIEVAEEEGDDEKAEEYRKELEKLKEERPKKREKYDKLIQKGRTQLCGRLAQLKPDGIKDKTLKKRVESTKSSIDCRKLLKENKEGEDGDEGASDSEK